MVVLEGGLVSIRSLTLAASAGFRKNGEPQPSRARRADEGTWLHPSDLLIPIALGLWALGVSRVNVTRLGPYGLLPALPILFYASLAVFLVSVTCELMRARPSPWRMGVHAVALVFMLYGAAPLIYFEARYEWFYKTVGVVQYINANGQLDRHIDIYQNWPGFFAFAAWFGKVAGISTPLSYGKWAQVAFELAAIPFLYLIYDALSLSFRQRWVAILLYSSANWVGQDYFSPQALSSVLSLGIMAIVMHWLYIRPPPAQPAAPPSTDSQLAGMDKLIGLSAEARSRHSGYWHLHRPRYRRLRSWPSGYQPSGSSAPAVSAILVIFSFLAFTHQLSPYMLVVQLGALAAIRLLRPRWLPIVLAAIAIAYLISRYSFVATHYGPAKSIGNFFVNLRPPSSSAPRVSPPQQFIQRCAEILSVGIWFLAGLGAWLNRQSGRAILGLVLLAYSPVVVLVFGSYGSEGILRVYLFSLPWSAALAAMVLAPPNGLAGSPAAQPSGLAAVAVSVRRVAHSAAEALRVPASFMRTGVLRIPVALGIAIALFFPVFYGDDGFNRMTRAEVDVLTSFWLRAQPGHVFLAINQAPVADTSRYNLFPLSPIFGSLFQSQVINYSIADEVAHRARAESHGYTPTYIIIADNMVAYNNSYGIVNPSSFAILRSSLQRSHSWKLVLNRAGVVVYMLPPLQSSSTIRPRLPHR